MIKIFLCYIVVILLLFLNGCNNAQSDWITPEDIENITDENNTESNNLIPGNNDDTDANLPVLGDNLIISSENNTLTKIVYGDLNGDGQNDIAALTHSSLILIYYSNGVGSLASPITFDPVEKLSIEMLKDVKIEDLNNDGKSDLIISGSAKYVSSGYLGRVGVAYQNLSSGELDSFTTYNVSSSDIYHLNIGDLNSDGYNDLISVTGRNLGGCQLEIFYSKTDGIINETSTKWIADSVGCLSEIGIGDMDNDSDNDIVIQSGLKEISVITQNSQSLLTTNPQKYSVYLVYWNKFDTFTIGDINNDKKNDIVVLDPASNTLYNFFLQNESGGFDRVIKEFPIFTDFDVQIADINYDGLNDLIGYGSGTIEIVFQRSDGTFSDPSRFYLNTKSFGGCECSESLLVTDVTGDGFLDVISIWSDEGLFILPNNKK